MYSGFSLIAVVFVYFCMDETKGLSEKQKKSLYIPGAKYGRKLREGEEVPLVSITPLPSPFPSPSPSDRTDDSKRLGIGNTLER